VRGREVFRAASLLLLAVPALLRCSSGSGGGEGDLPQGTDEWGRFEDTAGNGDDSGTDDTRLADVPGTADMREAPDVEAPEQKQDVPPGTKPVGTECGADLECESGLCWAGAAASGCTIACSGFQDCAALSPGLVCVPAGEGLAVCAPEPSADMPCATHETCVYPTVCVQEFNWCDLPECTFDADCPEEQACDPAVRKCQAPTCGSKYECRNPMDFCIDGKCGPPDCTQSSDCAPGEICSKAQGICTVGTPCKEGKCSFYNQVCVNGLCEPNLCATPCAVEGELCNPDTGKCGLPCASAASCPVGQACNEVQGICYENLPPMAAARIYVGGQLVQGATLAKGEKAQLDASLSTDPEGMSLTYKWFLISQPPGGSGMQGTVFCQQDKCATAPLTAGMHLFGLWVVDAGGVSSMQDAAAVYVKGN